MQKLSVDASERSKQQTTSTIISVHFLRNSPRTQSSKFSKYLLRQPAHRALTVNVNIGHSVEETESFREMSEISDGDDWECPADTNITYISTYCRLCVRHSLLRGQRRSMEWQYHRYHQRVSDGARRVGVKFSASRLHVDKIDGRS